jgi:hypothetical protein
MSTTISSHLAGPAVHRRLAALGALGLLGIAAVHLVDGPGSLQDTPYVGVLELSLAVVCVPLAAMMLSRPLQAIWRLCGAVTLLGLLAFVASRTVGLPSATDDIGNWLQPLGMLNLVTELGVLGAAIAANLPPRPGRALANSQALACAEL